MQRFRAFFVVLGLSMICVGISEVQVRGKAATVPQRLTLRQLEERGPGGNAHVEISEGFLCEHDFVYASEGGDFTDVWAPAVPRDSEYAQEVRDSSYGREPKLPAFRVLLKLPRGQLAGTGHSSAASSSRARLTKTLTIFLRQLGM